jgi:quinol monooxygenase YgiN
MDRDTVHIVAHAVARADQEGRVREEFETLVEPTRAEPGCISYELLVNIENSSDFLFLQEYVSDDAFQAHLDSKHVAGAIAHAVPLLVASPDIRRYRRLR